MGNVKKEDILDILDKYDKSDFTIATLGSHTSLHILQGAKEEGFRTAIVCEKGREIPYQRFGVADEYIIVDKFKDIVNEDVQQKLRDMNAIVIPHGSFVAYAGLDNDIQAAGRCNRHGNGNICGCIEHHQLHGWYKRHYWWLCCCCIGAASYSERGGNA